MLDVANTGREFGIEPIGAEEHHHGGEHKYRRPYPPTARAPRNLDVETRSDNNRDKHQEKTYPATVKHGLTYRGDKIVACQTELYDDGFRHGTRSYLRERFALSKAAARTR